MDAIRVRRDGSKVSLMTEGVKGHNCFFSFHAPDEFYARLVESAMYDELRKLVQDIRKESYERGWKDARAKRAKETYHSPWLMR